MTAEPTFDDLADVLARLPAIVRNARRRRRLTLRQAAVEIGVSYATVDRLEHDKGSNLATAIAVARWLGPARLPNRPSKRGAR